MQLSHINSIAPKNDKDDDQRRDSRRFKKRMVSRFREDYKRVTITIIGPVTRIRVERRCCSRC